MAKIKGKRLKEPKHEVTREERSKNAFFHFFELLTRKMFKLFALNIMYFICILPILCTAVTLLVASFHIPVAMVENTLFVNLLMRITMWIPKPLMIALTVISVVFYGPMTCGMSYVLRNFATEKHAWLTDFFSRAMSNFKQGILIGLCDILVFVSVTLYMLLDLRSISGIEMKYFYFFLKIAAIVISVFYIFMRHYLYTLAVTFELSIKDIFKNSYLFGVLGFGRNIMTLVVIGMVVFAFTAAPYIDIFLMATFTFSLCGFIATYITYPVIKKYMLDATLKPTPDIPDIPDIPDDNAKDAS
ncbi:MAG: hypothetical protein RSC43_01740 [Clostridia bacterium]